LYGAALDVLTTFVGNPEMEEFNQVGKVYALSISFFSRMFLFSFMIAMFILRYFQVWENIEASRRMDIIKLKNS